MSDYDSDFVNNAYKKYRQKGYSREEAKAKAHDAMTSRSSSSRHGHGHGSSSRQSHSCKHGYDNLFSGYGGGPSSSGMPYSDVGSSSRTSYGGDKYSKSKHSSFPYDDDHPMAKLAKQYGVMGFLDDEDEDEDSEAEHWTRPHHKSSHKHNTHSYGDPYGQSSKSSGGFPGMPSGYDSDSDSRLRRKAGFKSSKYKFSRHGEPKGYSSGYTTTSGPVGTKTYTYGDMPFGKGSPFGDFSGFPGGFPGMPAGSGAGDYDSDSDSDSDDEPPHPKSSKHHSRRPHGHASGSSRPRAIPCGCGSPAHTSIPNFSPPAYYCTSQPSCLYKTLDLTASATDAQINKAWKKASMLYHPDKAPAHKQDEYTEKMTTVNAAKDVLTNAKTREMYDLAGYVVPEKDYEGFMEFWEEKNR